MDFLTVKRYFSSIFPVLLVSFSSLVFAAPTKPNIIFVLTDDQRYDEKVKLRVRLYSLLKNPRGENSVPYTARLSSGAIYRREGDQAAQDFPPEWLKTGKEPRTDLFEGLVPDGPNKKMVLKSLQPQLEKKQ